jgi:hypothetical protein
MEASTVLVREIATVRSASKFSAASHRRVHGCIRLCEFRASRAALQRFWRCKPQERRSAWREAGIRVRLLAARDRRAGGAGAAHTSDGTGFKQGLPDA